MEKYFIETVCKTIQENLVSPVVKCACVCPARCHAGAGQEVGREEVKDCVVLHCEEAVGGRGGSALEIIPSFCPKSCARWADQGLREDWCYPVAVTQPRALHLTSLACSLQAWRLSPQLQSGAAKQLGLSLAK